MEEPQHELEAADFFSISFSSGFVFTTVEYSPYFSQCNQWEKRAMYYKVEISGVDTSKLRTLKSDETNELLRRHMRGINQHEIVW